MGPIEQPGHIRGVLFPIETVASFLLSFSCLFPPLLRLLGCIGLSCSLRPLLHWLGSLFFFFFFYPHLPSVHFINLWVVPLYGSWDQIRFTSGLNVCSHGLLHLKGNSFSWNFAVQFETRLMLANFTPPFFQNVSSIAHINCWWTKGICHFVMVMSGLLSRKNTKKEGRLLDNNWNPWVYCTFQYAITFIQLVLNHRCWLITQR